MSNRPIRTIDPPGPCFGWSEGISGDCGLPYGHEGDHVPREIVQLRDEVERLRAQITDETRATDELLDKLMDGEGELREHLRTLGGIVIDLANHPDPSYDFRKGDVICRFCHYVPGVHEPGRHVPGCVWRRAREIVKVKVAPSVGGSEPPPPSPPPLGVGGGGTKGGETVTETPPPCPRCGQPCHRIDVPIEPGDTSWVWGHDCNPYDYPDPREPR